MPPTSIGPRATSRNRSLRPATSAGFDVGHVLWTFLPRSETFIATQLAAQRELSQIVLCLRRENVDSHTFVPVASPSLSRSVAVLSAAYDAAAALSGFPLSYDRWLRRTVRGRRPRLLHAHFGWAGTSALLAANDARLPLITAFHGLDVYTPSLSPAHWRRSYPQLFADGTLFTCVGPGAMAQLTSIGCPPSRLRVVPVGLDLDHFPFAPRELSSSPSIIQVGRMIPKKGFDLTVRAFSSVQRELPGAHLSLVGDGPERPALERLVREYDLDRHVKFFGALPPQRVRELVKESHVGIQPSRTAPDGDREGSPTVLLEFQAAGLDVVATRHTDIPWIVANATSLVDENDVEALATALLTACTATQSVRSARLAAGRALVDHRHDATKIAGLLRDLYNEAMDCASSR